MRGISSSEAARSAAETTIGRPGVRQARVEAARVDRLDHSKAALRRSRDALAQRPGAEHRKERQRQDQRADQREDRRVGHRLEELARRAGEHVDRQEAGDDDRHGVEDRPVHFGGGLGDDFADRVLRSVAQRELAVDVLDHDDGAVDQDAEIDRADREQVGRDVLQVEADEREEQRERDRHGDDESRADVVEEEDQDDDDEHDPAQQVVLDGAGRQRDQVAAVVERADLHVFGQDRRG